MEIKTEDITSLLKQQLKEFKVDLDVSEVGEVLMVGDGVARVSGLENVMSSELVELPNGVFGMALNLEEDNVGLVLFGDSRLVKEGDLAKRTGKVVEVPVGNEMLGRVVNPLGQPVDGKGPINTKESLPAPSILTLKELVYEVLEVFNLPTIIIKKPAHVDVCLITSISLICVPDVPVMATSLESAPKRFLPIFIHIAGES